jgi:hypothetical protein
MEGPRLARNVFMPLLMASGTGTKTIRTNPASSKLRTTSSASHASL